VRAGRRDLLRDLNRTLALNLVRERGPLSRADVARLSGLSPSTVTAVTASLLQDGFLLEGESAGGAGAGSGAIGRPATMLSVNPGAGYVVGIKVTADDLTATVTDLAATPHAITTVARGHSDEASAVAGVFEAAVDRVLADAGVDRGALLGVGIGVPGVVDPETGRVADSPILEWAHLDLVRLLEERLALPVLVDNDVNTLTIAQQLFGAGRDRDHVVVVTVGRGIGMGIVLNGGVYRGGGGGAGELGHVLADPDGPDCWCGRRGCLEAVAAEPALVRDVLAQTGRLARPDDLARLADADPVVAAALDRAGLLVGRAIATVAALLAPECVVVSGEGVRLGPRYLDALRRGLAERERKEAPIELVIEPWGDEAWARGAATLVLRELFHPAHLRDDGWPTAEPRSSAASRFQEVARMGRGGVRR
jgi:predicted NBD/HSP70 family sugar kinase